jgi:hypothetical protein
MINNSKNSKFKFTAMSLIAPSGLLYCAKVIAEVAQQLVFKFKGWYIYGPNVIFNPLTSAEDNVLKPYCSFE